MAVGLCDEGSHNAVTFHSSVCIQLCKWHLVLILSNLSIPYPVLWWDWRSCQI